MSQDWRYCGHCGGLIMQAGVNYGWSGTVCHCAMFTQARKANELTQLREENAALRAEIHSLRIMNCELTEQRDHWDRRFHEHREQLDAARASEARLAEALSESGCRCSHEWTRGYHLGREVKTMGKLIKTCSRCAALAASPNAVALAESIAGMADAIESIAAEKCKPSFDEQLSKLERGALVAIIDTDTKLAREALEAYREARGEGK